ncbi:IPT/TIG domain-containing protein [Heliorestis convoluta]|uniref:IPT/TIG domain-containing protein, putative n=1 Tax=Heliorestis convoluta TaxID=356322 RepID=A0A5Q2N080_9FIRM|nr:IPT/TIG domain-containing protein [Heliorestis convoluta]QGG47179.1 IPT/TIG domain-containing protein, putative [Heliorestis convoluta]
MNRFQKTITILTLLTFIITLLPLGTLFAQDPVPTVTQFSYQAPIIEEDRPSVTFPITIRGTNLNTVNRFTIRLTSLTRQYNVNVTSQGANIIQGTVTIPATQASGTYLGLVMGDQFIRENIFYYHGNTVENNHLFVEGQQWAKHDQRTAIYLHNYGFWTLQNTAQLESVERILRFGTINYTVLTSDDESDTPSAEADNFIAKQSRLPGQDDTAPENYIKFYTPESSIKEYAIQLVRILKYESATTTGQPVETLIEEVSEVRNKFSLQGEPSHPPIIHNITAKPLDTIAETEISLQYRDNNIQPARDYVEVLIAAKQLEKVGDNYFPRNHSLLIKGEEIPMYKATDQVDTDEISHWYARIPRTIATKRETASATILRSDREYSLPFTVTLWADPYHRDNNYLYVNRPMTAGQIWLKRGDNAPIEIFGNHNAFALDRDNIEVRVGDYENQGAIAKIDRTNSGNNRIVITIGDLDNVPLNEPVPLWIMSRYGRSQVDTPVYFYSDESIPEIQSVNVLSVNGIEIDQPGKTPRAVERNAQEVVIEIMGRNFVQGVTSVEIGDYKIPATADDILQIDGAVGRMLVTLRNTPQLAAQPGQWPIKVTNGTGISVATATEKVQYTSDPKDEDKTKRTELIQEDAFAHIVGGFRFLSVPDFPTLPHRGDPRNWSTWRIDPALVSDYRVRLREVVETPTDVLDIRGGHIIRLKNGQDFYRVSKGINSETNMEEWLVPRVFIQYAVGAEEPRKREVPAKDIFTPEKLSTELAFRLPDLTTNITGDPERLIPDSIFTISPSVYVDLLIENPDGQQVLLPQALEIVDRKSERPVIDFFTPEIVQNSNDKTIMITGQNFQESLDMKPRVYMGFFPVSDAKLSYISSERLKFQSVSQQFIEGFQDAREVPIIVVNPDGTAAKPTKTIIIIRPRGNEPQITDIAPRFGPARSDEKPFIYIKGENFKPTGVGRVLTNIYIDEFEVFPREEGTALPIEGIDYFHTNELIAFPLPNIPEARKDMTIFLQFSDDTAAWSPFDLYITPIMTVNPVVPAFGPAAGSGLPMSDVIITGQGFGTRPEIYVGGVKVTQFNATPNDRTLMFKMPPLPAGKYPITIVNPDSRAIGSTPAPFEYRSGTIAGTPAISNIWIDDNAAPPATLRSVGGQKIVIEGSLFFVPGTESTGTNPADWNREEWPRVIIGGKEIDFGFTDPQKSALLESPPTSDRIILKAPPFDKNFFPTNETSRLVSLQVLRSDGAIASSPMTITRTVPRIESISPCGADVALSGEERPYIYITGMDLHPDMILRFGQDVPGRSEPGDGPFDVYAGQGEDNIIELAYQPDTRRSIYKVRVPQMYGNATYNLYDPDNPSTHWIPIRIFNPDGQSVQWTERFRLFRDEEGPTITAIEPQKASAIGGTVIRVTATNFLIDWTDKTQWPSFSFGGIVVKPNTTTPVNYPVDPARNQEQELVRLIQHADTLQEDWIWEVVVPEYPLRSGVEEQEIDFIIINRNNCTSHVIEKGFTYTRPVGNLQLRSITPDRSPLEGNITVTLRSRITANTPQQLGSPGFIEKDGQIPRVFFGTLEATVTRVTPLELTVVVPPQQAGKVDIIVINPDGSQGILPQAFTYADMPIIEGILPASGPQSGGTLVVLHGRGFSPNARVTFGNAQAEIRSIRPHEIVLVTPRGPAIPNNETRITVNITITNSNNESYTLQNGFTYYQDGGLPEEAPQILARAIDRSTIRVTWNDAIAMATAYEVEISEGNQGNFRLYDLVKAADFPNDQFYILVKNLKAETRYYFRVRAISAAGTGPFSEAVSATTTRESGWEGFAQPEQEIITMPGGLRLLLRQNAESYYDLRRGDLGAAAVKAITFAPAAQDFTSPVLLDNGPWKVLLPPGALQSNATYLTDSHVTIEVQIVSGVEADRILLQNRYRQPLAPLYEFKITYDRGTTTFTPAIYQQPITLTLNYQNLPFGRQPNLYWYDGTNRNWIKINSYADPIALSAPITRAGLYTIFAD